MKDAVATMGAILPDDAGGRDAVHVAVLSVVAGEKLMPGMDVGVRAPAGNDKGEKMAFASDTIKKIGIVDPFIRGVVWTGQRFWLYLYPRTITGLNHQWTHPDLPIDAPTANGSYSTPSQKLASEQWIREFSDGYGVDYTDMVMAAKDHLKTGAYFSRGGTFEGERVPNEFWTHFERVTGEVVPDSERESFFTCSC